MKHDTSVGTQVTWIGAAAVGLIGLALIEMAAKADLCVAIACVIALGISWRLAADAFRPGSQRLQPARVRAMRSPRDRISEHKD